MDIPTVIFVVFLCIVAFFVTINVRRDFLKQERQRRNQEILSRKPRRKP